MELSWKKLSYNVPSMRNAFSSFYFPIFYVLQLFVYIFLRVFFTSQLYYEDNLHNLKVAKKIHRTTIY